MADILTETASYISAVKKQVKVMQSLANFLSLEKDTYSGVGSGSKMQTTSLYEDKEMIYNWITSQTDNHNQLSTLSVVRMGGWTKTTHAMGNATSFTQAIDDVIRSTTSSSLGDSPVRSFGSRIDSVIRSSSPSTTDDEFDAQGRF